MDYMTGFGNHFETEALSGALPKGRNSPQKCLYKLYAEQLSGSPFTAPRSQNERSWLYRIRPSVKHSGKFKKIKFPFWKSAPNTETHKLPLGQYRWSPFSQKNTNNCFLDGVITITTAGDVNTQVGMASSIYNFNKSMKNSVFVNADAEMLFVPYEGNLILFTEMGKIELKPKQIAVLPRGVAVKILCKSKFSKGYLCENYGSKFTLPERGVIGANCLANSRDFKIPVASFEDIDEKHNLVIKWCGSFFESELDHSPLDVVAWHGNYSPYLYNLEDYAPVGAVSFDHPDPSIYTVLTAQSEILGTGNIDFVIFPERWSVAENTFRPPWYHKNIMSEFMGLICGKYESRPEGFLPGGITLHNMMLPHGPDSETYEKATNDKLKPIKISNSLAFMFETRFPQHVTKFAAECNELQSDYINCWNGINKYFDGNK